LLESDCVVVLLESDCVVVLLESDWRITETGYEYQH